MKKINLLISLMLILNSIIYSQVSGISASKLATICSDPVPCKVIEFEPSFGLGYSVKHFDNNGKLINTFQSYDSISYITDFSFRFSYGVIENLEIGTSIPTDMSNINFGTKYRLNKNSFFRTALIAGVNLPYGNATINKNLKGVDNSVSFAGGFVTTVDLTEKTGFDIDIQSQKLFTKTTENHIFDLFVNCDYSYWINNSFQAIIGLNYSNSFYEDFNKELLLLNVGVTVERHENFLIVINSPFDFYGKNIEQMFGLFFALTISIQ